MTVVVICINLYRSGYILVILYEFLTSLCLVEGHNGLVL